MAAARRKIAAVLGEFQAELDRLERFDAENQAKFAAGNAAASGTRLSKRQLHLMTEAIFFSAFRAYEGFIRDMFLLYCLEKRPSTGKKVVSFLRPRDFLHAERLIQSAMPFLDWSSPGAVIERSELYLRDGFPVKAPFTSNQEALRDFKRIRNQIAHNSKESLQEYRKVLKKHFGVIPLTTPTPGEYLLLSEKNDPTKYKLLTFFNLLSVVAHDLS